MKWLVSFTFSLLLTLICHSQSMQWEWARSGTGVGEVEGYDVTTDNSGNVYITGSFYGDSLKFGTVTLLNQGTANGYIAKYSPAGNVIWAIATSTITGSNTTVWSSHIAIDGRANIYVTGYYQSYAGFGDSILFGNILLPSTDLNYYLAKYDSAGHFLWVRFANANSNAQAGGIATDAMNNVYVTGMFNGDSAIFGNITLINSAGHGSGTNTIFILKYDSAGQLLWAQGPGAVNNTGGNFATGIATDSAGYVYATGFYQNNSMNFGNIILHSSGSSNIYLAKYDGTGHVMWAKTAASSGSMAQAVATDGSNHVYITGWFGAPNISFGAITLNTLVDTSGGSPNAFFITQYDTAGNAIWARAGYASNYAVGYALATDRNNNVYCTGGFENSSIAFDTTVLTVAGPIPDPLFIVEFNAAGKLLCTGVLGSGGDDQSGVHVDRNGNSYITSDFESIDPFVVGNDSLPLSGGETVYLAKFSCPNCYATNHLNYQLSHSSICIGDSTAITVSGAVTYSISPSNSVTWLDSVHAVLKPDTTTQYTIGGNLACGATQQKAFTLPVFDARAERITTTHAVLCPGDVAQMCVPAGFTYLWSTGATTACITTDTTGDYNVTASCNNQCLAISHQHITAISTQPFNVVVHGDTLSYDSATNYQWQLNGNSITGANSSVYVAHNGGSYTLQITDTAGCPVVSNPVVILGIQNITGYSISVYPNPSTGVWDVLVDENLLGSTIDVFDVTGKHIYKSIITGQHSVIDLPGIGAGVYELRINLHGNNFVRKLVKL